jgi:hypothetical protein
LRLKDDFLQISSKNLPSDGRIKMPQEPEANYKFQDQLRDPGSRIEYGAPEPKDSLASQGLLQAGWKEEDGRKAVVPNFKGEDHSAKMSSKGSNSYSFVQKDMQNQSKPKGMLFF